MDAPSKGITMENERYNIIISSETDARKKASRLSVSRRLIAALVCTAFLIVFAIVAFAALSAADAVSGANELKALEQKSTIEMPSE